MKKLAFFLLIIFVNLSFSQRIKGFGSLGFNLASQFDNSGFINVGAGLEFRINNFVRPEIQASFFFGFLQDQTNIDSNFNITSQIIRDVKAINYCLAPKITFDSEDNTVYWQIIPKLNFTNITANAVYLTQNKTNTGLIKSDSDSFSEFKNSFGIGIGAVFYFSENKNQPIALNLLYDNIDFGNAITNLKFGTGNYRTNQTIGIGINYYFGFNKKKTKN